MEKGQICTRKHEHVLKVVGYLVWMPSGQVDQERERVNIGSSSYQNGEQGTSNEDKVPLVLGEGEHCYAHVEEDEVLRQKREKFEQLKQYCDYKQDS